MINATRHNTESNIFETELQQLGLPKEHAVAMSKVLSEHVEDIKKYLVNKTLRINEMKNIKWSVAEDAIDCGHFQFEIKDQIQNGAVKDSFHSVKIHKNDIKILLKEMNIIKSIMEKYNEDNKLGKN